MVSILKLLISWQNLVKGIVFSLWALFFKVWNSIFCIGIYLVIYQYFNQLPHKYIISIPSKFTQYMLSVHVRNQCPNHLHLHHSLKQPSYSLCFYFSTVDIFYISFLGLKENKLWYYHHPSQSVITIIKILFY